MILCNQLLLSNPTVRSYTATLFSIGYRDIRIQGYKDTAYRDTGIQGYSPLTKHVIYTLTLLKTKLAVKKALFLKMDIFYTVMLVMIIRDRDSTRYFLK